MNAETIAVPEIHCGHCKSSIETALAPLPGVGKAEVDVDGRTVTITYDEAIVTRAELVKAIEAQGYEVPA